MTDFKALLQSRFGAGRGTLTEAAKSLDVNYGYLSNIAGGRAKPQPDLVARLLALPQRDNQQLDYSEIRIEPSLTDHVKTIQREWPFKDYEEAFLAVMQAGTTEFLRRLDIRNAQKSIPRTGIDPFE